MKKEYRTITVLGIKIRCYPDGSVEWSHLKSKETYRTKGTNVNGYRKIKIGKKAHLIHRLICSAFLKDFSNSLQVDHINGNRSDNRLCNLRMVTNSQNHRGFLSKQKGTTSKFRGVHRCSGKWKAAIYIKGKCHSLGRFISEIEAAHKYDIAAVKFGFEREALNFPLVLKDDTPTSTNH